MSHVVAVLNQKGGAGKSTLTTNLARALQLRGHSVAIADADPQQTAVQWRESYDATGGAEPMPAVFGVDRDNFDSAVRALVGGAFDFVLIDGAGADK